MKKILTVVLALLMLISLVACGTGGNNSNDENSQTGTQPDNHGNISTNTPDNNSEPSQNEQQGLNGASKDNYASLLKEYFGFDAKDIEEASFTLEDVRGHYNPNNDVQYMLTIEYENNDLAISKAYTEKMFELTKSISTTGSVFAALISEGGLITIGTAEYTDFNTFHDTERNNAAWYFKWNEKEILVTVAAAFTVRVQFSYSD